MAGRMFVVGGVARRVWALVAWRVAVMVWCRRLRIEGRNKVPNHPVVVVANHASHADTVVLQYVLATCHDRPVLVAGAEDYWFRSALVGIAARLLGVFAFPRTGDIGVRRTRRALMRHSTVVLFPQGSRSGGHFRAGVGRIVDGIDAVVIPVHLEGPSDLLPKGQLWPHRTDVVVRFGDPATMRPDEAPEAFAERLEDIVLRDLASAP